MAAGRISGSTIFGRLLLCFLASTLVPAVLITGLLCLHYDRSYRSTALEQMQISRNLIGQYINGYFSRYTSAETVLNTSAKFSHESPPGKRVGQNASVSCSVLKAVLFIQKKGKAIIRTNSAFPARSSPLKKP